MRSLPNSSGRTRNRRHATTQKLPSNSRRSKNKWPESSPRLPNGIRGPSRERRGLTDVARMFGVSYATTGPPTMGTRKPRPNLRNRHLEGRNRPTFTVASPRTRETFFFQLLNRPHRCHSMRINRGMHCQYGRAIVSPIFKHVDMFRKIDMAPHSRCLALPLVLALAGGAPSARADDAVRAGNNLGEAIPGPVFSDTGPDAAFYGAQAGFPLGPRATALQPEHLVGFYSHLDDLVPSRPVRRSTTPWLFNRVPEPTISYNIGQERVSIESYLGSHPVTGLLIARDDTILYEHYQYARTDADRFLSQSMAKTIVGMLIGIAISEGAIHSIDDLAD